MTHLLIVGALEAEVAALRGMLTPSGTGDLAVTIETIGVGKVTAAEMTQRHLLVHKPDVVVFAGVAGALHPDLALGDVGVVEAAIDADLDVRSWRRDLLRGEHPISRERVHFSTPHLVRKALAYNPGSGIGNLRTFPAFAATGSRFLDTPGKAHFIANDLAELGAELPSGFQQPNVIDMETSAFLQVANHAGVPALALRAVSDTTQGDAVTDFEAFLLRAADGYARILHDLIRSGLA